MSLADRGGIRRGRFSPVPVVAQLCSLSPISDSTIGSRSAVGERSGVRGTLVGRCCLQLSQYRLKHFDGYPLKETGDHREAAHGHVGNVYHIPVPLPLTGSLSECVRHRLILSPTDRISWRVGPTVGVQT